MKLYEILIPRDNPIEQFREWDDKVIAIAGAGTILKEIGRGKWTKINPIFWAKINPIFDVVIAVRIACYPEQMQMIASMTADHFNQNAMYYEIGNAFIFKKDK